MTTYKVYWINFAGHRSYLGVVRAPTAPTARIIGRRVFGPFGSGQEIEVEPVDA